MSECPNCSSEVPAGSRFCPECGRPLGVDEAGVGGSGARVWGAELSRAWWPPQPLVLVAILIAVGGVILLAGGIWAWGLVALLVAVLVAVVPARVDRRAAGYALSDFRIRAVATREAVAARSRGQVDLFRARRELAELEADRSRLFHDLGHAVYHEDETGMKAARTAVDAVVARVRDKEAEIATLVRQMEERVQRAQAPVRATEKLEAPPEPARVPEPWPPPDEGDLPEPPTPTPGDPVPGPDEPAPPVQPPAPGTVDKPA